MPRADRRAQHLALGVGLGLLALSVTARADDEPHAASLVAPAAPVPGAPAPTVAAAAPTELHALLAAQIAGEALTIDRALAIVTEKLAAADAARSRRARAAARLLDMRPPEDATPAELLAAARRAAAARLLLAHDAAERDLLATEVGRLREAASRVATEATQVAAASAPSGLAWPVHGTIARKFGPYEHERSHATLSRRGLDLEVEDHAPVTAPADGVVRYAGPIRGLEHGVILDAGGYLMVIAKLADPGLPVGTEVHRGDRVGRAAHHRVYLEIRVALGAGGTPIDPETALEKPAHDHDPKRRAR